jgi:hypothetical protein
MRKNPCDRGPGDVYVQERNLKDRRPLGDLARVDVTPVVLDDFIVFTHVMSKAFDVMNTATPFACLPNLDVNHVWYIFGGELRRAPLCAFVDVWVRSVFLEKCVSHLTESWTRWREYYTFVERNTGLFMSTRPNLAGWQLWKRSELYRRTCEAIRGHLSRPSRSQRTELRLKFCEYKEGGGELVMDLENPLPQE